MGIGVSGTGVTSLVGTIGRLAPPEKRLSAIASIGMAAGIGGFVALPVMHFLIELVGWQQSLAVADGDHGAADPAGLAARRQAGSAQSGPVRKQTFREALREAFQHPSFWLLTAGFFVCGFHVAFIMVHLPAFTVDQGLPTWVGPFALSVVGIANIVGTFIAGQSGRFIEKRRALSLIYFGRAIIFLGFLFLPMTPVTVIVLCGLLGLLWLATIPLTSGLVATFFGTTWMSMLFGFVFLSHQLGCVPGRVARRAAVRHDQVLRRHVVDLDRARRARGAAQLADPGKARCPPLGARCPDGEGLRLCHPGPCARDPSINLLQRLRRTGSRRQAPG